MNVVHININCEHIKELIDAVKDVPIGQFDLGNWDRCCFGALRRRCLLVGEPQGYEPIGHFISSDALNRQLAVRLGKYIDDPDMYPIVKGSGSGRLIVIQRLEEILNHPTQTISINREQGTVYLAKPFKRPLRTLQMTFSGI